MQVAQLLLAGGQGVRIGGNKPLRTLGGRSLLDHALAGLGNVAGPIGLSVRNSSQLCRVDGLVQVIDSPLAEGPLAGLIAGLEWAKTMGIDWLQTRPCDAPFLPHDLTSRLLAYAQWTHTRIALPRCREHLHYACGLWHIDILPVALARTKSQKWSLRGLASDVGYETLSWEGGDLDPFFNINTQSDLAAAEAWLTQTEAVA